MKLQVSVIGRGTSGAVESIKANAVVPIRNNVFGRSYYECEDKRQRERQYLC